jgi:hypothetical protein
VGEASTETPKERLERVKDKFRCGERCCLGGVGASVWMHACMCDACDACMHVWTHVTACKCLDGLMPVMQ